MCGCDLNGHKASIDVDASFVVLLGVAGIGLIGDL
jgi:hypothetical protein